MKMVFLRYDTAHKRVVRACHTEHAGVSGTVYNARTRENGRCKNTKTLCHACMYMPVTVSAQLRRVNLIISRQTQLRRPHTTHTYHTDPCLLSDRTQDAFPVAEVHIPADDMHGQSQPSNAHRRSERGACKGRGSSHGHAPASRGPQSELGATRGLIPDARMRPA